MIESETTLTYRILDANINRLREALRVVEEYFRFSPGHADTAIALKKARHSIETMVSLFDPALLLRYRDTMSDPFAAETRPEEINRNGIGAVITANLKRAQEAGRVIEEYSKTAGLAEAAAIAKKVRFAIYEIEKSTGAANG